MKMNDAGGGLVDTIAINVVSVGAALFFTSDLFLQLVTGALVAAVSTVAKLAVQQAWRSWRKRNDEHRNPEQIDNSRAVNKFY